MSFSLEPPNKIILEWDEENENHIRAHNVEPEEVESVFRQDNKIYRKKKGRITQLVGATKGGRVLFVVLEWQLKTFI